MNCFETVCMKSSMGFVLNSDNIKVRLSQFLLKFADFDV